MIIVNSFFLMIVNVKNDNHHIITIFFMVNGVDGHEYHLVLIMVHCMLVLTSPILCPG